MGKQLTLHLKLFRFNAETDYLPYYTQCTLEVDENGVMMDVLEQVREEVDSSFSYRRSCRHGICGSCAIVVNRKSVLSCKERVLDLVGLFGNELTIDPQHKGRVIKDLVIDTSDFWEKYDSVLPHLEAPIEEAPRCEKTVTPAQYQGLRDSDVCIQCGACYYACPSVEVNELFLGPAAFAKAYRFTIDPRDGARTKRLEIVHAPGSGVWDCVKCYECAETCPKGVDPIDKITRLHQQAFEDGIAQSTVATRHAVGFKHSIEKHGYLDEATLVWYSERLGTIRHAREAFSMIRKGKVVLPWNMPKSAKMDEIKKLIKSSSRARFQEKK